MNYLTAKLEELFGIDIRALGLMRIGISVCILIHLADLLPYTKAFFSDQGILPRTYAIHFLDPNSICLNLISGSWVFQALLLLMAALFTVGLLLGYRTQVCTLMVWILLSSIHNRNYLILNAGDKLLHILLFWFLFLPWGACYSLDSRHSRHPPPLRVSSMGTVAYLLQISFFYTFVGLSKTSPEWTTQGTAIYYALNLDEYSKPLGHVLLQHPLFIHQLTFVILWLERCGALFFFIPFGNTFFRLLAVAAFLFFHIGLMLSMELGLFQWVCLSMLIGFLPTPFLDKILGTFNPKSQGPPDKHSFTWKPNLFTMPAFLSVIIAFFVLYVFCWNIGQLENPPFKIAPPLKWIGYTFNVRQHWKMFAPGPMKDNGWLVMPGKLRNGQAVDIFNSGAPLTWEEPGSIQKLDKQFNWILYYQTIRYNNFSFYRGPWAGYLCHEWNSSHPYGQQLLSLEIYFMEKSSLPDYQKPVLPRVLLADHDCFKEKDDFTGKYSQ